MSGAVPQKLPAMYCDIVHDEFYMFPRDVLLQLCHRKTRSVVWGLLLPHLLTSLETNLLYIHLHVSYSFLLSSFISSLKTPPPPSILS
jgi:hypothetical protein